MADLCKYYKKQRCVSYNSGTTWTPLDEYEQGELYEAHSSSCGSDVFQYRWTLISNGYICDGKDRYTRLIYQYSEDGVVWYNIWPTVYKAGTLVESNSPYCDNAGNGQYIDDGTDPSTGTTCPPNYTWNGTECVCSGVIYNGACYICKGGQVWSGSECVCTGNTYWNGSRCAIHNDRPINKYDGWAGRKDPYKAVKCSNSNGILTSADTQYYDSGWAILSYEVGDCIYRIDDNAFNGQQFMTAITIASSVSEVGKLAFSNCMVLPTITFNSDLEVLDEGAFTNCSTLALVVFKGSIPSVISKNLFLNCAQLQSATWLQYNDITTIDEKAFYNCYSLSGVTFPQTLETIGNSAFTNDHSIENITIPSGVTSIGDSAFANCTGLTFINIDSNDILLNDAVFANCTSLTAATFNSSAVTMGSDVFYGCTRLLKLTFTSPTPFEIEDGDFDNTNECAIFVPCDSVDAYKEAWSEYADRIQCNDTGIYYRWVDDPSDVYCDGYDQYTRQKQQSTTNGITWTDTGVYRPIDFITHYSEECGYEGEVVLTVTNADGFTRYYEPCDESVYRTVTGTPYCSGETMHDKYVDTYYQITYDDGETWVTTATTTALLETESLDCGTLMFEANYSNGTRNRVFWDGTTTSLTTDITKASGYVSSAMTNAIIGDVITSIDNRSVVGEGVFDSCTSLSSVTIGSGVTSIGNGAFYGCSSLTSIDIPSGVTSIGDGAFYGCSSLTSIDIPSGVTSIGDGAFYGCSSLTSVTVEAETPPALSNSSAFDGTNANLVIYVLAESVEVYKSASQWSYLASRIQAIP